jgi:hypothetical protein
MDVNGCNENLPMIIIENGQGVFRGNYYVDYINSEIEVIQHISEIITNLNK